MLPIVLLTIVLSIMATIGSGRGDYAALELDQATIVAGQMSYYHNRSLLACQPLTCTNGVITPVITSGAIHLGAQGNFTAVYDAATKLVVTTWSPSAALGDPTRFFGLVAAAIHDIDPGTINAGAYNRSTGLVGGAPILFAPGSSNYIIPPTPVPSTVGGMALVNNAPVMASHIQ